MNTSKWKSLNLGKQLRRIIYRKKVNHPLITKAKSIVEHHSLIFAIIVSIIIALLLTVTSTGLYLISGTAKLDLSRPGYESARTQINRNDNTEKNFSSTGLLDDKVLKGFLKTYDKEVNNLHQYSTFKENLLDDTQLGLTGEQIPASDGASTQP